MSTQTQRKIPLGRSWFIFICIIVSVRVFIEQSSPRYPV